MSTNSKIYVGNLSYGTTQADLENMFSQYGKIVEIKLITDRDTGRSKGFAFVTYSSSDEANMAVTKANGMQVEERKIIVNMARDDDRRRTGGAGAGRPGQRRPGGGGFRDRDRY